MKTYKLLSSLLICLALSACGGGETEKVYVPDLEQGGVITPSMSLNASFDNGRMALRIPAGISDSDFTLKVTTSQSAPSTQQVISNTYTLSPEDKTLLNPIEMEVFVDLTEYQQGKVYLARLENTTWYPITRLL